MTITVRVRPSEIAVTVWSFFTRHIDPVEIAECEIVTLPPYQGRGIRVTLNMTTYTMIGDQAVKMTMTNGRAILIGSGRAQALHAAIEHARSDR